MSTFQSHKKITGFSTCFRQWKAKDINCRLLHGYSIEFDVTFQAEKLDERNWVMDFGFMTRYGKFGGMMIDEPNFVQKINPKDWFNLMFDHTTIIAKDDPELETFKELDKKDIIKLRVLENVGCERFAEYVAKKLNDYVREQTNERVRVVSVTCSENSKNSATFYL